ncbi:helix-turn-helix domain-containing protein [Rothia nasimurium]|uniref:helix-turn-helix domain-containing protein n=1 Tax=Rothia nasimurium TaxID=85336 RepID=UPI001F464564|nr:helix-turn-helix transcriptional regulator [Rothia nasimurium]
MSTPYFRIARISLGLTANEIGKRIGKSLRSVRLYDAGELNPAPETLALTADLVTDMSQRLEPYISVRSGTHKTFTLFDYGSDEELHAYTNGEYDGWTLGQYRSFLGHVVMVLEAKGISYQFVQYESEKG